ncbi:hypothetical protein [Desulfospira joergensenii]|uniref:hypothetical protein n=1 Tax=Desulfospira joergensenii TaxID=53329 RepID=UPI0003B3B84C|nr:hypothetical protein [Desulfospira joergensenii]
MINYQELPPGWGNDSLSKYLEQAYKNTLASFVNLRTEYQVLHDIVNSFGKIIDHIQKTEDLYYSFFIMRVQCSFMGSISLALAGQTFETYLVLRGCLEVSLYGLYISQSPKRLQIWLNREKNEEKKERCKKTFSAYNTLECLRKIDNETFCIAQKLYDLTIDLGAHPNATGVLSAIKACKDEKAVVYKTHCLAAGDTQMMLSLKTCAQVGVCSLQIFKNIFPQKFDILGISEDLNRLKAGL